MKVTVIIELAKDGSFWVHTENPIKGVGLNATGATVEAAKNDFLLCCEEAKTDFEEYCKEWGQIEFVYKYDLQSFFNYFSFLNVSEIAKRSGINPSLMRQYSKGIKRAGEKTYTKMSACIKGITNELQTATF